MTQKPQFQTPEERRADRRQYGAIVQFRQGSRRADVKVRDVSMHGARISGVFLARTGDQFYLKFAALEPLLAQVVWVEDFEFGCEFERPLSNVVFDAITTAAN